MPRITFLIIACWSDGCIPSAPTYSGEHIGRARRRRRRRRRQRDKRALHTIGKRNVNLIHDELVLYV